MGSWKGDISNPSPNNKRESIARSEKIIGDNRAKHVRRDKDGQENITIGFYDIDEAILLHLERLNLHVVESGQQVKVPSFYGSPEIWTSARRDGYLRDNQGKILLPAMTLKRTNSESDPNLKYFHRYLQSSVMKKYSSKNKYTQFSLLSGQMNAPTNEVFNIVFPNHMQITYHFIIWTEYVEQMNTLVQEIQFNTKDYWGTKDGFKFRTRVESFTHQTELQVGEDRIVKTEFDLTTNGYILPETITTLATQKLTTEKMFTPKKFIVNLEAVESTFNLDQFDKNREKWRNPEFPNLPKDEEILSPKANIVTSGDTSVAGDIVKTLTNVNQPITPFIPPIALLYQSQVGVEGQMAYDDQYFYIYGDGQWNRVALATPSLQIVPAPSSMAASGKIGQIAYDTEYFYIYSQDQWRKVAISEFQ
jgi:hypothetical protein